MQTNIQDIIVDLKVLAMIEPNGKVWVKNGRFALEPASIILPLKRYMYNINRYTICQNISNRVCDLEHCFVLDCVKDDWMKYEIHKTIEPVKQGLFNLQQTYLGDSQITAILDITIARVNHIAEAYLNIYQSSE